MYMVSKKKYIFTIDDDCFTQVVSAKYIMKTDDDAFVRVDEVMTSLNGLNISHGLLYGLINSDSRPHRNPDSKWYISPEEWSEDTYLPWAHGPGYVVFSDIATTIYKRHKKGCSGKGCYGKGVELSRGW